jgi:hypothetical protein
MKDFFWILLKIIFWLVVCIMPTPIKMINQSWTCPQLKQYSSSICYHQSSLKLSNHPDMHLIACSTKAHGCMLSVILHGFLSALSNQIMKGNALASSMMFITHIHAVKCAFELQSKWSHSQSWWVHLSDIHSNATMR